MPKIATLSPGPTRAVLTTAPTPVITAQPNSAAICGGSSGSTRTVALAHSRSWVVEPPGTSRQAPEARLRKVDPDKVHCVVVPALQGNCTTGPPDAVVLAWAMHRPLCLATNCR